VEAAVAAIEPSRALKLVLDELERADSREVVAAAVGDLIALGAWDLTGNIEGRHRKDAPQPLLTPCNRRPPEYQPLAAVDALLRAAPKTKGKDVSGRGTEEFARFVAEQEGGARAVVEQTLDELVAEGVFARGEPYVVGAFRGVRHTRTEAGDAVRRAALPEHSRNATIARLIVADDLTRALSRRAGAQRGQGPDSSGGSNTSAAVRYGIGF
jgi:hypothetical protein